MNTRIVRLSPEKKRAAHPPALPFVLVNMAMTADGKIATANRSVSSFGSKRDLAHLYALRATADAVVCGARTASLEDLHLGPGPARYRRLRLKRGLAEYNLRILVSGRGRIDLASSIFTRRFSPILILTTEQAGKKRLRELAAAADQVAVCGRTQLDFRRAFAWLRSAWRIERLLCEGGGELNAALFADGLVDELHLTICPFVFGGAAAPTIADGPGPRQLADAAHLRLVSRRRVGAELFCVWRRQGAAVATACGDRAATGPSAAQAGGAEVAPAGDGGRGALLRVPVLARLAPANPGRDKAAV